jgi:hypothetical protein
MSLSEKAASVFDLVFGKLFKLNDLLLAIGFAFLAVMFILNVGNISKIPTMSRWVLIGYYIFFCIFMTLSFIKSAWLLKYCGFLKGFLTKTVFYVL